jgi:hypothetical protein
MSSVGANKKKIPNIKILATAGYDGYETSGTLPCTRLLFGRFTGFTIS